MRPKADEELLGTILTPPRSLRPQPPSRSFRERGYGRRNPISQLVESAKNVVFVLQVQRRLRPHLPAPPPSGAAKQLPLRRQEEQGRSHGQEERKPAPDVSEALSPQAPPHSLRPPPASDSRRRQKPRFLLRRRPHVSHRRQDRPRPLRQPAPAAVPHTGIPRRGEVRSGLRIWKRKTAAATTTALSATAAASATSEVELPRRISLFPVFLLPQHSQPGQGGPRRNRTGTFWSSIYG